MYTLWKRTVPPASLATFDAPDREKCAARRPLTNTPLQALKLMNDPTYVEAARSFAHGRCSKAEGSQGRVICVPPRTGRTPTHGSESYAMLKGRLKSFGKITAGRQDYRRRRIVARHPARSRGARRVDDDRERHPQSGRDDHETMNELDLHLTRRQFFGLTARGIGAAALGALLREDLFATAGQPACQHFAPKAKRVIFLHQSGGPSQLDMFDYKPELAKFQGNESPIRCAWASASRRRWGSRRFWWRVAVQVQPARPVGHVGQRAAAAHGEDRRRHLRRQVDETEAINHDPADHVHPDRHPAAGPAEHGRVAQLRPRQRERRTCRRSSC